MVPNRAIKLEHSRLEQKATKETKMNRATFSSLSSFPSVNPKQEREAAFQCGLF